MVPSPRAARSPRRPSPGRHEVRDTSSVSPVGPWGWIDRVDSLAEALGAAAAGRTVGAYRGGAAVERAAGPRRAAAPVDRPVPALGGGWRLRRIVGIRDVLLAGARAEVYGGYLEARVRRDASTPSSPAPSPSRAAVVRAAASLGRGGLRVVAGGIRARLGTGLLVGPGRAAASVSAPAVGIVLRPSLSRWQPVEGAGATLSAAGIVAGAFAVRGAASARLVAAAGRAGDARVGLVAGTVRGARALTVFAGRSGRDTAVAVEAGRLGAAAVLRAVLRRRGRWSTRALVENAARPGAPGAPVSGDPARAGVREAVVAAWGPARRRVRLDVRASVRRVRAATDVDAVRVDVGLSRRLPPGASRRSDPDAAGGRRVRTGVFIRLRVQRERRRGTPVRPLADPSGAVVATRARLSAGVRLDGPRARHLVRMALHGARPWRRPGVVLAWRTALHGRRTSVVVSAAAWWLRPGQRDVLVRPGPYGFDALGTMTRHGSDVATGATWTIAGWLRVSAWVRRTRGGRAHVLVALESRGGKAF